MVLRTAVTQFPCPGCKASLAPVSQGPVQCPACRWVGEANLFTPRALLTDNPEAALPDEASCLYHPSKKATAVCAGTGDYICSLCTVELEGQTYGVEYLNSAGKKKVDKAFERDLPRPDSQIRLYILLMFVPYINVIAILFAFIWLPHAFYLYFKALRERKANPLFRRVMGRSSVVLIPIVLVLIGVGWIAGVGAITMAILNRGA